jgi:hypothetical protein
MNKKLLLEKYVKVAVRKALAEQEKKEKEATKAMYLVYRFPGLKKVMEELLTPAFGRFISDVKIVAPKPTTFTTKLINEQDFNIIYNGKTNFTVKIAGKKYNIQNLGELERAQQAISNVLELNYAVAEGEGKEEEFKPDAGAEAFSAAGVPENTPPTEETPPPTEEIPPPTEETPPAEA